jgi:protocatechuate 3,4-dioxygenase beta subunit
MHKTELLKFMVSLTLLTSLPGCNTLFDYGTIEGQVTDTKGNPVPNAKLVLDWVNDNNDNEYKQSFGHTLSNGQFSLSTRYGNVILRAEARGFAAMNIGDHFTRQNSDRKWNFALPKSGSISGKLMDTNGKPMPDRIIYLYPIFDKNHSSGPIFHYSKTQHVTGKDGSFKIENVAPCKHKIITYHESSMPHLHQKPVNVEFVELKPGMSLPNFELKVNPPEDFVIAGTVKDAEGKPINQVYVHIDNPNPHLSEWGTFTDQNGHFSIEGLDEIKDQSSFIVKFWGGNNRGRSFDMSLPNIRMNAKDVMLVVPGDE